MHDDVSTGDVDLFIAFGDGTWPGRAVERLRDIHITPVCSPVLLNKLGGLTEPADLLRMPIEGLRDYCWTRLDKGLAAGLGPGARPTLDRDNSDYVYRVEDLRTLHPPLPEGSYSHLSRPQHHSFTSRTTTRRFTASSGRATTGRLRTIGMGRKFDFNPGGRRSL